MKRIILFLALLPFMVVSANAQSLMVGDANGDGFLDISDVVAVVNRVLEGNPASYRSCPDTNHPHLIDLGLPSGTLWSCCNVDATKPQDNGGYYAWGETQIKSSYDYYSYAYKDATNRFLHLGYDISGTNYDVAHVKWKGNWKMPSLEQFDELCVKCNHEFTQFEGVDGVKFTGPNGGTIFFPNSGYYSGTSFVNDNNHYGYVWTSSVPPKYSLYYGYTAMFSYDNLNEDYGFKAMNRFYGFTVRPIQNESTRDVNHDSNIDITDVVMVVNKILNGKFVQLSCPDNCHPHKIDLGLPSGTLWSCSNVGAISPLSSGYLYAWGETETKYRYDGTTYRYCDNQDEEQCQDIGASIIGTQYDVATEKIGTSWQMPSHAQINELINNCTGEWIQIDDAKGFLFTGPNGKSIFFPAAGFAYEEGIYNQSTEGRYWMGECHPTSLYLAKVMVVKNSGSISLGGYYRVCGLLVRPVAK